MSKWTSPASRWRCTIRKDGKYLGYFWETRPEGALWSYSGYALTRRGAMWTMNRLYRRAQRHKRQEVFHIE